MTTLVTDAGFGPDDWTYGYIDCARLDETSGNAVALNLEPDFDVGTISQHLASVDLIRLNFTAFTDGRPFSQARHLRMLGYSGRLRAAGDVLADQYTMARRSGIDEIEIDDARALHQPEAQWRARANWQTPSYQSRLRQIAR